MFPWKVYNYCKKRLKNTNYDLTYVIENHRKLIRIVCLFVKAFIIFASFCAFEKVAAYLLVSLFIRPLIARLFSGSSNCTLMTYGPNRHKFGQWRTSAEPCGTHIEWYLLNPFIRMYVGEQKLNFFTNVRSYMFPWSSKFNFCSNF